MSCSKSDLLKPTLVKPALLKAVIAAGTALCLSTIAQAQDSAPATAQASGQSAAASVETAATLGSGAAMVLPSSTVLIAGSGASLITGDPAFTKDGAALAEDMLSLGFDGAPLEISDDVLIADDMPALPREPQ